MSNPHANRIPVEDISDLQTWSIPVIEEDGNVVPCAEKEDRERRVKEARGQREVVGEEVETDIINGPITAEQLAEITESARQEGYGEGFKLGYEEGQKKGCDDGLKKSLEEGREQNEKQQRLLSHLIDNLRDPYQSTTNRLQSLVLDTVVQLVRSIVQRELITDSSQIVTFVRQAINALPTDADNLKIYLNPDDMVLLENFSTAGHKQWQLHADSALLPGGCRIETKQSIVDYSVEERMRELFERFVNGELSAEAELQAFENDSMMTPVEQPLRTQVDNQNVNQDKDPPVNDRNDPEIDNDPIDPDLPLDT